MSDLTNATISVYNSYSHGLPPWNITRHERAIIRGVVWQEQVERNPDSSGKTTISQSVLIIIPKGADQGGKTYIDPVEYAKLSNDAENYWTLSYSVSEPTYIVLGEGRELNDLYTIQSLMRDHRVVEVKGVSDHLDFPGDLAGLEARCI